MELLDNPVRPYAWGSRTVIAELLGRAGAVAAPAGRAVARARTRPTRRAWCTPTAAARSLLDALRADPERLLGADRGRPLGRHAAVPAQGAGRRRAAVACRRTRALEQAARRVRPRGGRRASPRDAPDRNYRDANHKPELICALTEFHALVGFRDPAAHGASCCARWTSPELAGHAELLAAQPGRRRPARAVHHLDHAAAVRRWTRWCRRCRTAASGWPGSDGEFHAEARTVLELSERYPGDAGVLAALLLNRVTLAPGRGAVPAGRQPARLPVRGRHRDAWPTRTTCCAAG